MKIWYVLFLTIILAACTDYVNQIEDERDDWRSAQELTAFSSNDFSSSVILSSDSHEESSNSDVNSCSSEKITSSYSEKNAGTSSSAKAIGSSSSAVSSGESHKESSSSSVKSIDSSSSDISSSEGQDDFSSSVIKSCSSEKSSSSINDNGSSSSENSASIDVNEAPYIEDAVFIIEENSVNGNSVGVLVATDPDSIAAFCFLTYSIIENDIPFILDSNEVKVGDASRLDYESDSVFTFHVRVTDGELSDTALVVVKLKDVDEISSSSEKVESSSSSEIPKSSSSYKSSSSGISYGTLKDSRDGKTYKTIVIGTQTWMAENLNYETINSYCYKDSAGYCSKYGRLYTWAAAMDSAGRWSTNGKNCGYNKICSPIYPLRGVCPSGFHLPTKAEFETLISFAGGQSIAGKNLKSKSGWNSALDNGGNGTDAYYFSALPAGEAGSSGNVTEVCGLANFWSSTEDNDNYAYFMKLNGMRSVALLNTYYKYYSYSVRCVKN